MGRRLFDYSAVPRRKRALILALMLFGSVLAYLFVSHFVFKGGVVDGVSMEPTLHDGDRYVINRVLYHLRDPRAGEIVALRLPGDDDLSVKRVIALPRDAIQIRAGAVHVNGRPVNEPYLSPGTVTGGEALGDAAYKVADGCYFVLGDNRGASADSRRFGAVKRAWIMGRVRGGPGD